MNCEIQDPILCFQPQKQSGIDFSIFENGNFTAGTRQCLSQEHHFDGLWLELPPWMPAAVV